MPDELAHLGAVVLVGRVEVGQRCRGRSARSSRRSAAAALQLVVERGRGQAPRLVSTARSASSPARLRR